MEIDDIIRLGLRIVKALVLGVCMFFASWSLGLSAGAAAAVALIPALLGSFNVMIVPAFTATALTVTAAILMKALPSAATNTSNLGATITHILGFIRSLLPL
jgi:hypothetical protein